MANSVISGVTLRRSQVEWTSLRRKKNAIEVADHRAAEVAWPADPPDLNSPEAVAALKKACAGLKGTVVLGIPTDQVLLRVVDLPSTEPEELAGMVDLQVDKFSPFAVEHMAVSFEILSTGEGTSRVLVVAARKEVIDTIGVAFHRTGHSPREIDVNVLGWWHLLKEQGLVASEGRHVLLIHDVESIDLVVAENGVPVLFRSLGGRDDWPGAAELAEETSYTLTTLEADRGSAQTTQLTLWYWEQVAPELETRLREECLLDPELRGLGTLPPLSEGLARRSLLVTGRKTDLSPSEWHDVERTRRVRHRLLIASATFLLLWLLAVSAFLLGLRHQHRRLERAKARVEGVEGPAEQVRVIQAKVRDLEQYADRTRSGLECLREVSQLLPRGVDLTSFSYSKGKDVDVRGETDPNSVNLVYDFFEAMEKSPIFRGTSNEKITTRPSGGRPRAQFSVTAALSEEEAP